jgi:aryl-alcohol dehydrogenase-like predicted oxidoreductase
MYGDSEEKIGRALRGRRSQCFLCTKCGRCPPRRRSIRGLYERAHRLVEYRLMRSVDERESLDWQPRVLEWNIDQSLRRLGVDCIDIILLHSCSEETLRRGAVIEVLHRARQAGKARYVGYSGDGPAALYAVQCGQFEVLETSINIADQEAIDSTVPLAVRHGMGVIAKRPIANVAWKSGHKPSNSYHQTYWDRLRVLRYEFLQGGDLEKSVAIALQFPLSVPGVCTAIVGTTKPERWEANARLLESESLGKEEFRAIRERWEDVAPKTWIGQT